jgi:pimeloyl-ACP methyl ester carboxylesterase
MTPVERDRVARVAAFMRDEYGYIAIQSTRPGLIGVALADSPAAQLAWMLDKLKAWTYPPAALPDSVLGREWMLANASLYWFTASGGSAAYAGYARAGGWGSPPVSSRVPTAAIQFAHDVGIRSSSAGANAIVRWTDVNDRGGHFAALEEPELLADDIRQFLRGVRDRGPVT